MPAARAKRKTGRAPPSRPFPYSEHLAKVANSGRSCKTPPVPGSDKKQRAASAETPRPEGTEDESSPSLRDANDESDANEDEGVAVSRSTSVASTKATREERRAAKLELDEDAGKESSPLLPALHLAFVVAAAVGVYSFVSVAKEGEIRRRCTPTCILRPNYSGYEKKTPSFTLKDTRGQSVSIESYRGRVVVLNFWTKTCGPCMEEMPEIADLARILRPMNDVAVLTVSTDESAQDAVATMRAVLKEEAPFPVLMDPEASVVRDRFGTSLYPETWIIDKDGVIRARFDGAREWSNATVVELVNQIRGGGYCPVQAREGKFVGDSQRLCDSLGGG